MICVVEAACVLVRDGAFEFVDWLLLAADVVGGCTDTSELVGEGVVEFMDWPLLVADVFERCTEVSELGKEDSATLLLFEARLPPTPPPTAAPIITTIPTIAIQNVLRAKPQMRRSWLTGELYGSLIQRR